MKLITIKNYTIDDLIDIIEDKNDLEFLKEIKNKKQEKLMFEYLENYYADMSDLGGYATLSTFVNDLSYLQEYIRKYIDENNI
ncbi:MAG: hypothetical protein RBR02_06255 [Desulfuromonadaceae bacterium]|nr:hypothetical protein [Desulfuromonadaceae bacterium]